MNFQRNDIYTPQEHKLMGSTLPGRYYQQPHTPLAVVDGILSVEQCNELRIRNPFLPVISSYFGERGYLATANIFPLDTNPNSKTYGTSLEDPILIQTDNRGTLTDRTSQFPFPRQGPRTRLNNF